MEALSALAGRATKPERTTGTPVKVCKLIHKQNNSTHRSTYYNLYNLKLLLVPAIFTCKYFSIMVNGRSCPGRIFVNLREVHVNNVNNLAVCIIKLFHMHISKPCIKCFTYNLNSHVYCIRFIKDQIIAYQMLI